MDQIMRLQREPRKGAADGPLRIAETFTSRQGEGRLTGTPSFFIRTSGCNLRCWFCDTPYASWRPEGDLVSLDWLLVAARASGTRHVVLTGGEPLLPAAVSELVRRLRAASLHVTIETAGTVFRPLQADLMSISPKLAGSGPAARSARWHDRHEAARWRPEVIHRLIQQAAEYQIKFVVDRSSDFDSAVAAVDLLGLPAEQVWIMPQATSVAELERQHKWLQPRCAALGYRYCDRMQIRWYGNRRGT